MSYVRAHTLRRLLRDKAANAATDLSTQETVSNGDASRVQDHIHLDEQSVRRDQREVADAQAQNRNPARAQQMLAADLATLNADRMMAYTVENFSRTDPDPRLVDARNQVDVYQSTLLDAQSTMARDRHFAMLLAGLWAMILALMIWAFRGVGLLTGAAAAHPPPDDAQAG